MSKTGKHTWGGKGSVHARAKLTEAIVVDIKRRLQQGERGNDLAREYGVTRQAVCNIKNGRAWTHVHADGTIDPVPQPTLTKQQAMQYLKDRVKK